MVEEIIAWERVTAKKDRNGNTVEARVIRYAHICPTCGSRLFRCKGEARDDSQWTPPFQADHPKLFRIAHGMKYASVDEVEAMREGVVRLEIDKYMRTGLYNITKCPQHARTDRKPRLRGNQKIVHEREDQ